MPCASPKHARRCIQSTNPYKTPWLCSTNLHAFFMWAHAIRLCQRQSANIAIGVVDRLDEWLPWTLLGLAARTKVKYNLAVGQKEVPKMEPW